MYALVTAAEYATQLAVSDEPPSSDREEAWGGFNPFTRFKESC
jgi:hypothetical protein